MTVLTDKELSRKLAQFSSLPSLPQNIIKIKQVSENPHASAADLANCILSDHQLTSRVLQMANSVYYANYSGKVRTITHAIVMMGFRAIHNIAISMSVYEVVNKLTRGSNFDILSFWIRSLACGVIAKFLASRSNQNNLIESAFIAGFMHDIGQPILAGAFPEKYKEMVKMKINHQNTCKIEQVIFGTTHIKAGEFIASKWNMPKELVETIAKHHRLDKNPNVKSSSVLVDLVYLADNLFNHVMGETSPVSEDYTAIIEQAQKLIDISEEDMIELLIECRQQINEIAADLEIDIERELARLELPDMVDDEMRRQLNEKEMHISFLQNSTDALMEAKTNDEILGIVCEAIFRGMQMGRVILFEYNSKWESFTGKVGFGVESQEEVQKLSFSIKKGLFKNLRKNGKAVLVDSEESRDYKYLITEDEAERLKPKAFAVVPIIIIDEVNYAIFVDAPKNDHPIENEAFRSMISLTKQATLTLERNYFKANLKEE